MDASAEAIGQQALVFASSDSSGSSGSTTGWSSSLGCPDGFKQGFSSTLPAGSTVVSLDPATAGGLQADPALTTGDIPNCALKVSTTQAGLTALVFLNMDESYQDAILSKLQADGFVGAGQLQVPNGTEQEFTKGALVIEIAAIKADGLSAFAVMGRS